MAKQSGKENKSLDHEKVAMICHRCGARIIGNKKYIGEVRQCPKCGDMAVLCEDISRITAFFRWIKGILSTLKDSGGRRAKEHFDDYDIDGLIIAAKIATICTGILGVLGAIAGTFLCVFLLVRQEPSSVEKIAGIVIGLLSIGSGFILLATRTMVIKLCVLLGRIVIALEKNKL